MLFNSILFSLLVRIGQEIHFSLTCKQAMHVCRLPGCFVGGCAGGKLAAFIPTCTVPVGWVARALVTNIGEGLLSGPGTVFMRLSVLCQQVMSLQFDAVYW